MSEEIRSEIKEILRNIKQQAQDNSYDFDRSASEISKQMKHVSDVFLNDEKFMRASRIFLAEADGYSDEKYEDLVASIENGEELESNVQQELSSNKDYSFGAGLSNGILNKPRLTLEEKMDAYEDEENTLEDLEYTRLLNAKLKEHNYRFNKSGLVLSKVDEDGKKLYEAAKYNPLSQKFTIANSDLQSTELAEILTLKAKAKGWNPVSLSPPNNQLAQEFMEINLRALMNFEHGYLPSEVNVPNEYKALKASIAAEIHNGASLKQTSAEDIKLQAKEAIEDPVVDIEKQPEPELESEVKEAIDLFDNKDDLDFKQESNDDFDEIQEYTKEELEDLEMFIEKTRSERDITYDQQEEIDEQAIKKQEENYFASEKLEQERAAEDDLLDEIDEQAIKKQEENYFASEKLEQERAAEDDLLDEIDEQAIKKQEENYFASEKLEQEVNENFVVFDKDVLKDLKNSEVGTLEADNKNKNKNKAKL